jgi:hypothetical protein
MEASSIFLAIYEIPLIIVIGCLMTCILLKNVKIVKSESLWQINCYILNSCLGNKYGGYNRIYA